MKTVALVILAVIGHVACGETRPGWVARIEAAPRAAERRDALEAAILVVDAMVIGRPDLRPLLERVAVTDPNDDTRQRALEVWRTWPHPVVDDRLLLDVLIADPNILARIEAARAYPLVWGEEGLRLLSRRFEACGASVWFGSTCYPIARGLAERPRASMAWLMGARDVERSSRREAELAVFLAMTLIEAEPALRDDPAVRTWLEPFATRGETARIREGARRLLHEEDEEAPAP